MSVRIIQGDVFDILPTIQPGTVDATVTSPPYWLLRSYLPKGHPLKHLEIGQEKTPHGYVAKLVRVLDLVRNALADHGTCWLNIADTYCDDSKHGGFTSGKHVSALHGPSVIREKRTSGIPAGNMALIPQRLVIALQDAGWIVRSLIVWLKPAPMPASLFGWRWERCRVKVKSLDVATNKKARSTNGKPHAAQLPGHAGGGFLPKAEYADCPGCRKCTETGGLVLRRGSWRPTSSWEPVLMLAKTDRYFCDGEAVKTEASAATLSRNQYTRILDDADEQFAVRHDHESDCTTANMRDVWEIGHEPLRDAHYAAYPTALGYRCLAAAVSQKGYCSKCGSPWVRVIERKAVPHPSPRANGRAEVDSKGGNQANGSAALGPETKTLGWRPSCECGEEHPPRPGLVLDPFSGSGRTAIQATRMALDFVGVELNPLYASMSEKIIREDNPLFSGV